LADPATYSESQLVDSLRQRNEKAFSYLYDNYSGALYGIINAVVNDLETANDVLQDVFVNIWKKIETYDATKGRLFTWMLNIARNAAIDKIRSKDFRDNKKNRPLPETVDMNISSAGPEVRDVGLKKVISKLKDEQRVLIDLSYFQGFTHEEIARALDIPLGTVKTRIRSALLQLRALIG
jgi:RNA polymerase sigma-70 factor (ECF subfamily)